MQLVVKNTLKHRLDCLIFYLTAYVSLHSECLSRACWPINHHVAALSVNEGITELLATFIEDLVLTLELILLLVKNIFEVEVPLSIVKVVVGEDLKALFILHDIDNILTLVLYLQQWSHSCRNFDEDLIP